MADTIREQIIAAIVARFQGITKTAGYKSDLGNNIYHFRDSNFEAVELPAMNIVDWKNNIVNSSLSQFDNVIDIELQIKAASGETTYQDAYDVIEDVYKAIGLDDTWGQLALNTVPGSDEINIKHAGMIISGVTITIQVQYEAAKWTF